MEGFETFNVDTDETVKLQIVPASPNTLDWLTLYEVRLPSFYFFLSNELTQNRRPLPFPRSLIHG